MTLMAGLTDSMSSETMDIKSNTSVSGYCDMFVEIFLLSPAGWIEASVSSHFKMKTGEYYFL